MLANGLFYSKLSYCLPLYANVWGLDRYRDGVVRCLSFTKEDNRKLQVLQNQVAKLLTNRKFENNISTKELLKSTGDLSIHQTAALRTINLVKKVLLTKKPTYLANQFTLEERCTRSKLYLSQDHGHLGLVKEGFVHRGKAIFNMLPENLKQETNFNIFKVATRKWVLDNIEVKP